MITMQKYLYGTEFIDPTHGKSKIVNYDDTTNCYICTARYNNSTFYRHEDVLVKLIKGECEMEVKSFSLDNLSDEELNTLLTNAQKEVEKRQTRQNWEDWEEVTRAISKYLKKHRTIIVNVNEGQEEIYIESNAVFSERPGVIFTYD